jgi:hypothetical protein
LLIAPCCFAYTGILLPVSVRPKVWHVRSDMSDIYRTMSLPVLYLQLKVNYKYISPRFIFVCLFICKSSPMIHCGNRSFLVVTWQMFEKLKTNVEIIGSKAKSCCNGVQHHFLRDSSVVRRHYISLLEPSNVRAQYIRKTADLLLQLWVSTFPRFTKTEM